jgi:hypothetical protein
MSIVIGRKILGALVMAGGVAYFLGDHLIAGTMSQQLALFYFLGAFWQLSASKSSESVVHSTPIRYWGRVLCFDLLSE